jgi:hypothetical protein
VKTQNHGDGAIVGHHVEIAWSPVHEHVTRAHPTQPQLRDVRLRFIEWHPNDARDLLHRETHLLELAHMPATRERRVLATPPRRENRLKQPIQLIEPIAVRKRLGSAVLVAEQAGADDRQRGP